MEYHEVYLRDGTRTGQIKPKHAPRVPGDYFLHTIVILKAADSPPPGEGEGRYILQQRSLKARFYAGCWDVTGGGVRAGETPAQAAVRETREELGLTLQEQDLKLFHRFRVDWDDGTGLFISVFACRCDVPEGGFAFDPYEVNDVRVAPFREFYACVMDHNDDAFGEALRRVEREV